MSETHFLQGFGLKGRGSVAALFVMGAVLYFLKIFDPAGAIVMIVAVILLFIDIAITLNDKAIRSKRGY